MILAEIFHKYLTCALDGGDLHALAVLLMILNGERAGWAPQPVWMQWKSDKSLAAGGKQTNSSAVQPVAWSMSLA
jgi:hypothetical protein